MHFFDLLFIFGFLPITLLLTFLEKSCEYKNFILVLTSVVFFVWGRPFVLTLIFLSIVFDYVFARICEKSQDNVIRHLALAADFVINISCFVFFAWNKLFVNIEALSLSEKLIPLGIAFYSVRGFSYVYDVYKKNIPAEKNIFYLMTYMINFHLMIVGPIVRYGDISKQLRSRHINSQKLSEGFTKFIIGLSKIIIIVPVCSMLKAEGLDANCLTVTGSWIGMVAFIGEFVYGWSGFTDMAIGLGKMNGFDYPQNFLAWKPSECVLGAVKSFNATLVKFAGEVLVKPFRDRNYKLQMCMGILWCGVALGAWYSLKWNYIIAGLVLAVFIIFEKLFLKKLFEKIMPLFSAIYTSAVIFVVFGILNFNVQSDFSRWFKGLFGVGTVSFWNTDLNRLIERFIFVIIVIIVMSVPYSRDKSVKLVNKVVEKSDTAFAVISIVRTVVLCLLLLACTASIGNMSV